MRMLFVLLAGVVLLVIYEIHAALTSKELTISQIVWRVSTRTPFVPFMFGVLAGHFFAR